MAKILVTGATGFVGRSLVPALLEAGHEVRCAVSCKVDYLQTEQAVIDRLENQKDWSEVLQGIDTIIHLAARVHIMQEKSKSSLDEYCKVNSLATKSLAEQAAKHGVKRFIFLSSIKVNGESTAKGCPYTEESIAQPEDPYGQSKLEAEQYLHSISQSTKMQIVILRPPLIYGAGVKANFLKMLKLVDKGLPLPFGKVQNRRSFIYIDNLISALCAVIAAPEAANQVYLVADDGSLSLAHLMDLIAKEMKVKVRLLAVPVNLLTLSLKLLGLKNLSTRLLGSLEVSNSKIKSQLGWTPPVSSVEGLGRTVKWYKYESNS
ncbi:NAD-dependent epimerase/dehydratase family protein [Legionella maioricensis]|uniref:NAD-dependent epimerase/dehydratase family protein n=1 Tax=Legionella maioricensis TaxID=2896528 RepID=A0A9X2I9X4_9GAMM|nr:NAD-dependent epimerase/dehydratase family protein [Legionella maioricensis]MCL9683584.1 NAD-dependent epimerase/dehydratase family protein [Legionella maioricensis]MCL9686883.1 NAD-dependent epimerase/dehydratase family protein [Legionella maioricensis]